MALIIMRHLRGYSDPKRQDGLGSIECLNLRLLVDAQDDSPLRWITSAILVSKSGSVLNLKVSTRWGCSLYLRQMLRIVVPLTPIFWARARELPCVPPMGGRIVSATIWFSLS